MLEHEEALVKEKGFYRAADLLCLIKNDKRKKGGFGSKGFAGKSKKGGGGGRR